MQPSPEAPTVNPESEAASQSFLSRMTEKVTTGWNDYFTNPETTQKVASFMMGVSAPMTVVGMTMGALPATLAGVALGSSIGLYNFAESEKNSDRPNTEKSSKSFLSNLSEKVSSGWEAFLYNPETQQKAMSFIMGLSVGTAILGAPMGPLIPALSVGLFMAGKSSYDKATEHKQYLENNN